MANIVNLNVLSTSNIVELHVDQVGETVEFTLQPNNITLLNVDPVIIKVSGEPIPSYTPVAIVDGFAYKLNNANTAHQFAFVGFSVNGTNTGENCQIKTIGEVDFIGWGLTPNQQYLAGSDGAIVTTNNTAGFTKVIGYAVNPDKMLIIKEYTSINK